MPIFFSEFTLTKVSATGNDFLIADLLSEERRQLWARDWQATPRLTLTRQWCDRHEGLGADGLVVLEPHPGLDFKWDFYNSDGGSAEMCGNAARAVSLYLQQTTGKSDLHFLTLAGPVQAHVSSAQKISVELPAVAESAWGLKTLSALAFDFVCAGVPHAVVKVAGLQDRVPLREMAKLIKAEARFRQAGVNVTFVHTKSAHQLESVTYERGVEDFTLACGTGAVAAAFSVIRGEENQEIEVQVPGGRLSVLWNRGKPTLMGPAKIVGLMRAFRA